MDIDPGRRIIRREVVRTERVRREATVRLSSTRAMRLGARLLFRGLIATVRRRPVQLTLRSNATRTPVAHGEADEVADRLLRPAPTPPRDVPLK